MDKLNKKSGVQMCLRWYTLGYCFEDCKYTRDHGINDNEEHANLKMYMCAAREERAGLQQRHTIN